MPIKVNVSLAENNRIKLHDIPDGTFFTAKTWPVGNDTGPLLAREPGGIVFVKVGSISANTWIVFQLNEPTGPVWTSNRNAHFEVRGYTKLEVTELDVVTGQKV